MKKPTLLHLTDFFYQAKGRVYYSEDIFLIERLRPEFNIVSAHIEDCQVLERHVAGILRRNTGPRSLHLEAFNAQNERARRDGLRIYNDIEARGDFQGKAHLLELYELGFPVIPTYRDPHAALKQSHTEFIVKKLNEADSRGMQRLGREELERFSDSDAIIQPLQEFRHEESFYFIDQELIYSTYSSPGSRWGLLEFDASTADHDFARRFVSWNKMRYGIQRIDACRLPDDSLLLMEIEDYNPYLSIAEMSEKTQNRFFRALIQSLKKNLL